MAETKLHLPDTRLTYFLLASGFSVSPNDPCVFTLRRDDDHLILCVYVDYLILAFSSSSLLTHVKSLLSSEFSMKDLCPLHSLLGLQAVSLSSGLFLHQAPFSKKIVDKYTNFIFRPYSTPLPTDLTPSSTPTTHGWTADLYRQAVGSLMYLMVGTRQDLSFPIGLRLPYYNSGMLFSIE